MKVENPLRNIKKLVPSDLLPQLFKTSANIELLIKKDRTPIPCGRMLSIPSRPKRKETDTQTCRYLFAVPTINAAANNVRTIAVNYGGEIHLVGEDGKEINATVYQVSEGDSARIHDIINQSQKG